ADIIAEQISTVTTNAAVEAISATLLPAIIDPKTAARASDKAIISPFEPILLRLTARTIGLKYTAPMSELAISPAANAPYSPGIAEYAFSDKPKIPSRG